MLGMYLNGTGMAPPMSVPHLDTRYIDGQKSLLFGPFAGFTPNFLKCGSYADLILSVRPHNIINMIMSAFKEFGLVKYLVQQLLLSDEKRLKELQDKPVSLPDVVGKQVRHKTYGVGVVQSNDNGTLLVHFEKADKKFKYPSVFTQGFLSFAGEETQTGEMAEFEADQKKKAALEKEITQLKKSLKSITV